MKKRSTLFGAMAVGLLVMNSAHAQLPVIDISAILQLIREITFLEQQLAMARSQYLAMTGPRGMQNLLGGQIRNYLPTTFNGLLGTTLGGYGVPGIMAANAVLTPAQLALLSPAEQGQIQAGRQDAAVLQGTTRQALETTSNRFATLQGLITAIAGAEDQKSALDLATRIQAEQAMLQNDQAKLSVIYQTLEAQEWARRQNAREQVISDVGSLRALAPLMIQ